MQTLVLFFAADMCLRMGGGDTGVWLIGKELLRAKGLEVCPPGGEDPGMRSSCDEIFCNSERDGGGGARVGGGLGFRGVGLCGGVRQVS